MNRGVRVESDKDLVDGCWREIVSKEVRDAFKEVGEDVGRLVMRKGKEKVSLSGGFEGFVFLGFYEGYG